MDQAALILRDAWQQHMRALGFAALGRHLQQCRHVGHPAADATTRNRLEVSAVSQGFRLQFLTHTHTLDLYVFIGDFPFISMGRRLVTAMITPTHP